MILAFTVAGVPQPKGSTQAFGYLAKDEAGQTRTRVTKTGKVVPVIRTATKGDNPKTAAWQADVAKSALVAMANARPRFQPIAEGAVSVSVDFFLPRPAKRSPLWPHTTRPDLDKLVRAVADALTRVVWTDDGQVDRLVARKFYAHDADGPRVEVAVYRSTEGI